MASAIPELLGLSISEGVAFALGIAIGPALEPLTQEVKNKSWSTVVSESNGDIARPLDVGDLAAIVAESVEALGWGRDRAREQGINEADFDALFHAEQDAPGFATLLQLLRRGLIDVGDFEHGLRKAKFEGRWDGALEGLRDVLLTPSDLANARQQGYVNEARQKAESALQGVSDDRAELLYLLAGLPPGPETGLEMLRRSIITADEFATLVREGHTKTKYTDELLALRNRVLTASDYASLWLRGWISEHDAKAGGALTGYDAAAMDLLYLNRGRPATTRQAFIGYTRGGRVQGQSWDERETHKRAVEQSNIRTEWEPVLWAQRYTYPSAFVLRNLTQSGDITQADAEKVLLYEGWEPDFAAKVSKAWAGGATGATDPHVAKAQTQLWTTLHTSYKNGESDEAAARDKLHTLGVPADAQTAILNLWNEERELIRKQLTPTQIKKAWKGAVTNEDTGQPWTRDDAVAALVDRGYSVSDANTFLDT